MTAQNVADLFRDLELRLISSLKRNLARHREQERQEGGENEVPEQWEAWQSAKLRDLQRFRRENEAIIEALSPVIDQETKTLIQEQYEEGGADGFFHMKDRRIKALLEEMETVQTKVEKAALRYMDDVYRHTVQGAALNMATGSMTMQQAVDVATKDFLAAGITCIQYRNGRRVNIASYAEMALRTAATRATLQGEAALREQLGIDTVLVSQYGACSDTCLPWQGLVYIDDVFQAYSGRHTQGGTYGVSRNGQQYPLLSVAVRAGLFHPNCRHTLTTWNEGVSRRPKPMDKAKIEAASRLESQQRYLERRVREAKRRAEGLLDPDAAKEARRLVRRRQAELKEFVDAHGDVLRRDPWRERYDGSLREQDNYFSDLNTKNIVVTIEAVKGIREFPCETLTKEASIQLKNAHKRLLTKAYSKDADNAKEIGQAFDLNMRPLTPITVGEASRIRRMNITVPYIFAHTHPDGNLFSPADLARFAQLSNLRMLTAVGHNGRVYAIEKGATYDAAAVSGIVVELSDSVELLLHQNTPPDKETLKKLEKMIRDAIKEMEQHGARYHEL